MAQHNQLGREGEALAVDYLKKKGYAIRDLNWRFQRYELDIVAQTDSELVIVEVKSRTQDYLVSPEEAIGAKKIRMIVSAADAYIKWHDISLPARFDVLTVVFGQGAPVIDHIEDAFYSPLF